MTAPHLWSRHYEVGLGWEAPEFPNLDQVLAGDAIAVWPQQDDAEYTISSSLSETGMRG